MKKNNQKQVSDYLNLLDDILKPTVSNGMLRVAKQIHKDHGITATFRYLTNQAGLSVKDAHEVIKNL